MCHLSIKLRLCCRQSAVGSRQSAVGSRIMAVLGHSISLDPLLPFRVSLPFVYVQVYIFIAPPHKCASVSSPFPSQFAPTEILTGECVQHDNSVRNKSHVSWLVLSCLQY